MSLTTLNACVKCHHLLTKPVYSFSVECHLAIAPCDTFESTIVLVPPLPVLPVLCGYFIGTLPVLPVLACIDPLPVLPGQLLMVSWIGYVGSAMWVRPWVHAFYLARLPYYLKFGDFFKAIS